MERIIDFELAGRKYPLNFSVKAARQIDEKFGSLDNLSGIFGWQDITTSLYNVSWALQLLMEQGAAYRQFTTGETVSLPSIDELEMLLGAPDLARAQKAVMAAIGLGMEATVEVEPDTKNAETTQDK